MPPDYRSLQQWAKENGVKANQRKVVLDRDTIVHAVRSLRDLEVTNCP